jgi:phage terminase large subunit
LKTQSLQLSETQSLALQLLNDPQLVELLFGGGAGGAKSVLVCIWMVLECRNYPGIRIGLGREELVRLKQTTVVTLISKVHGYLGVKAHEFVYNDQKGTITYRNGSSILLIDMAYQPRDPDYDTFGSLELTHVVIEEVGEVRKKGVDVLTTRKNRMMNAEYGIVGKTVLTCNPTQNFIKDEYYEPYKALGLGRHQKWPHGEVQLADGQIVTAYRAFIRSLVFDNPFASRNYIETLRQAPAAERKRLLMGDWDVLEGDYMLFTDLILDRASIGELQAAKRKVLAADLADGGKDNTALTLIEDGIAVDQEKVVIDRTGEKDPAEQNALAIIKYAQQHGVLPTDVGIDGVGIGAGTRVALRNKGWFVQVFVGGASPTEPGYENLRAEQYYKTSQDMQTGALKIYAGLPDKAELRKELAPHEYLNNGKVIKVTPKDKVKEAIGRSPDRADSLVIGRWLWNNSNNAVNHIIF